MQVDPSSICPAFGDKQKRGHPKPWEVVGAAQLSSMQPWSLVALPPIASSLDSPQHVPLGERGCDFNESRPYLRALRCGLGLPSKASTR